MKPLPLTLMLHLLTLHNSLASLTLTLLLVQKCNQWGSTQLTILMGLKQPCTVAIMIFLKKRREAGEEEGEGEEGEGEEEGEEEVVVLQLEGPKKWLPPLPIDPILS
jgi:hypothetical protein